MFRPMRCALVVLMWLNQILFAGNLDFNLNGRATNTIPPLRGARGVSFVPSSQLNFNRKEVWHEAINLEELAARNNTPRTPLKGGFQQTPDSNSTQTQTHAELDTTKQQTAPTPAQPDSVNASAFSNALKWIEEHAILVGAIISLFLFAWGLISGQNHLPRFKKWLERSTVRRRYVRELKAEHENIHLLGFQASANMPVRTLEVFVSLRLADAGHGEMRGERIELEENRVLSPEQTLQRAFFGPRKKRLLLILGDPGSGKTTLLKYYTMCCFDQAGRKALGLPKPLLPIFVPLRKIDPYKLFCAALSAAVSNANKPIPQEAFAQWLESGALVLLDGLDELSSVSQRQRACKWIDEAARAYGQSYFIVTSRFTGYRASDDVELLTEHKRGDVLDLDSDQQETFLKKWFAAAYHENGEAASASKTEQAQQVASAVRDYLALPENESLRRLAGTPVLLQIMAILWKEYGTLVSGRAGLYEKCTDYLLDRRDRVRELPPPLPAEQAKIVLRPLALFMQETLKTHDIRAEELTQRIERVLEEVKPGLKPETFIEHLRDRAALLKDFGENRLVFSHNSFREFLAAGELADQIKRNPERSRVLVENFTEGWWRETILFCLSLSKPVIFAEFFERFLPHANNSAGFPELLQHGLKAAQHKPIAPFQSFLRDQTQDAAKRYSALLCLRAIASEPAKALVKQVWDIEEPHLIKEGKKEPNPLKQIAEELLFEWKLMRKPMAEALGESETPGGASFRNPAELNAEYLLIPGGKYRYSITKQEVEVPPIYFAKYPVTNKLYRRFIAFLAGDKNGVLGNLSLGKFAESLLIKAKETKGFAKYLGEDPKQWAGKLRSNYDDDKRFNDDEQPVVGVSWFAAVAYCHWLNELQRAASNEPPATSFRLPHETEWEWAASGGAREYPWGDEPPDQPQLRANYASKVGQTTPVGSYPDGATPERLMDMAGNVWEWSENLFGEGAAFGEEARALRGGSWYDTSDDLRGVARGYVDPDIGLGNVGFRVVRFQSHFLWL